MTDQQKENNTEAKEKYSSPAPFNIENPFGGNQYLRDLVSFPAVMTYIGTAVSIYSILNNNAQLALSILGLIALFLFWTAINTHVRLKKTKDHASQLLKKLEQTNASLSSIENKHKEQIRSLAEDMHRLVHKSRDYLTDARTTPTNGNPIATLAAEHEKAIKTILSISSKTFSKLIGVTCTSSLMLKDSRDKLQTIYYCTNVSPDREGNPANPLRINEGIAGQAMTVRDVRVWSISDTHSHFVPTRTNNTTFYKSGLCVPFKQGYAYVGLLNIDAIDLNSFSYENHKHVGAAFADMLGLIFECHDILRGNYGNA